MPHLTAIARAYIKDDPTLEPAARADRLSELDRLDGAVADASALNVSMLLDAWSPVREWYRAYLSKDAGLSQAEKDIRLGNTNRLDAMITAEMSRPFFGRLTVNVTNDAVNQLKTDLTALLKSERANVAGFAEKYGPQYAEWATQLATAKLNNDPNAVARLGNRSDGDSRCGDFRGRDVRHQCAGGGGKCG